MELNKTSLRHKAQTIQINLLNSEIFPAEKENGENKMNHIHNNKNGR